MVSKPAKPVKLPLQKEKRVEKKKRQPPALLELLNERQSWELPPYRKPEVDAVKMEEAARLWAQAYNADPFAYQRIRLHMLQGFELVSDVRKDASGLLNRRLAAIAGGVVPVKQEEE
jgi:hypothetical protein